MVARSRFRQGAVGRRLDFETAVARQKTGARIIMTDFRLGRDRAAAIDGRLHVDALAEAKVAFDDGVGYVDAVDDNGNAGAARNDEIEAFAGQRGQRGSDQHRQCKGRAHGFKAPILPPP